MTPQFYLLKSFDLLVCDAAFKKLHTLRFVHNFLLLSGCPYYTPHEKAAVHGEQMLCLPRSWGDRMPNDGGDKASQVVHLPGAFALEKRARYANRSQMALLRYRQSFYSLLHIVGTPD